MGDRLQWQTEGRNWPHREASRFVDAGGLCWHVQEMPASSARQNDAPEPVLLLVHGTGASTHSWRGVMRRLSKSFRVIAPDLPGHGFTSESPTNDYSLRGMAGALGDLLKKMDVMPDVAVGHSAGAAILARMRIDGAIAPRHLVFVNGAVLPLRGIPGEIFSPMAKVLSRFNLVPRFFSWRASDPAVLDRLLRSTGSSIDSEGRQLYGALISNPKHAAAVLEMMAQWDLKPLHQELPRLAAQDCMLTLMVGENDLTVSPREATRICQLVPGAELIVLPTLGHLAHEESPDQVCELIEKLDVQS